MEKIRLKLSDFEKHLTEFRNDTKPEVATIYNRRTLSDLQRRRRSFEEIYGYSVIVGYYGHYPNSKQVEIIPE